MSTEEKPFGVHEGGCHCGYISYSMKLSPPLEEYTVLNCNCSICRRAGYLLVYPKQSDVTFHNDSKARCSVYEFNTKTKGQMFCPKCGVSIGIDFRDLDNPPTYGISARTVHDVNLDKLNYKKLDGINRVGPAKDLSGQEHANEAA